MLMIRLQRVGRKHEPIFRLVATDSQNSTKSGKFLEILGQYDPRQKGRKSFNGERIKHWISKGAKVSGTVNNLLIDDKIITGKKINVLPKKKPIIKEEVKAEEGKPAEVPVETTPEAPTEVAPEVAAQ